MIPIGEARKYIHEMYKDNIFSTQVSIKNKLNKIIFLSLGYK